MNTPRSEAMEEQIDVNQGVYLGFILVLRLSLCLTLSAFESSNCTLKQTLRVAIQDILLGTGKDLN